MGTLRVFLIAGEPSGDRLGADLMAGLKTLHPDILFHGIGGERMMAQGMNSLFPMKELSLMGIVEILPKYVHLKRRIRETAQAAQDWNADVVITIDSPDFCLRVNDLIRAQSKTPIIHYVAPSVWAWRAGRAQKMARSVDHVLALLPFEPPLMQQARMSCDFVGHPVATIPPVTAGEETALRQAHGITGDVLVVLPGSRRGEISRLMPIFTQALTHPDLEDAQVVIPTLAHLSAQVRDMAPKGAIIIDGQNQSPEQAARDRQIVLSLSRAALAASGTISLELAAAGTPMVIAYDVNWITRQIMQRMLRVDTVTLVNLVSETRAVPEFIGKNCRADMIAPRLAQLWKTGDAAQEQAMKTTMRCLGYGQGAQGERAARSVLNYLQRGLPTPSKTGL